MVAWRVVQGAMAALLFPAAVGIVVASFPLRERGRAMSIFFGIAGGLTAVGPLAGGYLVQWTWRAIFWINIPVAIIALVLIHFSKPDDERRPQPLDYKGTALVTGGMTFLILGLQQSASWGWSSAATWACIALGAMLLALFVRWELRCATPLLQLRIFRDRGFAVDNAALALMSIVFVPFFFFGSIYAQVSLGRTPSNAGVYILYFFFGFLIGSLLGGRLLDRAGARRPVVIGGALGAVGFYLLAGKLTSLSLNGQIASIMLGAAGIGLMLTPASTDAVSRAPSASYSEVTGITQTARNFGASLGLAILGSVLISETKTKVGAALIGAGVPHRQATRIASSFGASAGAGTSSGGGAGHAVHAVHLAFAESLQPVFYAMSAVLAATFVITLLWLPRGKLSDTPESSGLMEREPTEAEA